MNKTFGLVSEFNLQEKFFDHPSHLHGINHTYRVMTHCIVLGNILGFERETKLALCGAYIHDMARKHDSKCFQHGAWAAEYKFPTFFPLFKSLGVPESDQEEIKIAVQWHSLPDEIDLSNPFRKTVALLKDADALDRIRLGEGELKVERLRFPETVGLADYAKRLYYNDVPPGKHMLFSDYLALSSALLGRLDVPEEIRVLFLGK